MDTSEAVSALAALAQPTRLETVRRLAALEPRGAPAGDIARAAGVPQNTMSSHLAILSRAGLVSGERRGRSIVYRANLERFRVITRYLLQDCCGGRPELCAALIEDLTPCCQPEEITA